MQALLYMILGVGVFAGVAWLLTRGRRKEREKRARQARVLSKGHVTNDLRTVRKGGVLRLPPFGKKTAPFETYVTTRHRYNDRRGVPWYELELDHEGRRVGLEWKDVGSELDVSVGFTDENPSIRDLGVDESALATMDEEHEGSLRYRGKTFTFISSGEAVYFENDGEDDDSFWVWNFSDEDDDEFVTIEKWEGDDDFECYHSYAVDPQEIEVFATGEPV